MKDKYSFINEGIEIKFKVSLNWSQYNNRWTGRCIAYWERDDTKYEQELEKNPSSESKSLCIHLCNKEIKKYIKECKAKILKAERDTELNKLADSRRFELHFVNGKLTDKV